MLALGIDNVGVCSDHVVATEALHTGDSKGCGEFITGNDGTGVSEALFTVDNAREVDTGIWLC